MNKKILFILLVIVFVPTIIAAAWFLSVSGDTFTPSNVSRVVLKAPDGFEWEYTEEEEKEFFTTLATNLVSIEKQEYSEDEWTLYELYFERTLETSLFYLCLSPNAKNCLAFDNDGNWYRINTENARSFLVREELEGLYTNNTYPEMSVLVAGNSCIIPARHYEWSYLLADESFSTVTDTKDDVYSTAVTVSSSLGLKLDFSTDPDWCDIKIFDGEALVFSGDREALMQFSYENDAELKALVSCEWYQDAAKLYYGKTISEFYFDYDVKASAVLNKDEFAPGEVISIKLINSSNDTFAVTTDLKTTDLPVQRELDGVQYILLPLANDNKTGDYQIKLVSGNTTLFLSVYVGERAIEQAAFSLNEFSSSDYENALNSFYDELGLSSYVSKLDEPLWKRGFITPVKKYDGEKERYWISAPVYAAEQAVNGNVISTLNFSAHYIKSVELDYLTARSVADGVIAFAGETALGGNTVVIDHGFGLFSVYAHLGEITLEAGTSVTKGMTIGNSDNSGIVIKDGELLFAIIQDGVFVNPYNFIIEQRNHQDLETFDAPVLF